MCELIRVDIAAFEKIKIEQQLHCQFIDYPELLLWVFRSCMDRSGTTESALYINNNQRAILEVHSQNELRRFKLIQLDFAAVPDDIVKTSIAYRFSVLKAKNDLLENRLVDIVGLIKRTNPSLALLIQNGMNNE